MGIAVDDDTARTESCVNDGSYFCNYRSPVSLLRNVFSSVTKGAITMLIAQTNLHVCNVNLLYFFPVSVVLMVPNVKYN